MIPNQQNTYSAIFSHIRWQDNTWINNVSPEDNVLKIFEIITFKLYFHKNQHFLINIFSTYFGFAIFLSSSGERISLSNVLTMATNLGRWERSFCQQSNMSW